MGALLYVVFVTIGGLLAVVIGYLVEPVVSMTASLSVFLALFFANFVVSWMAVVLVMNGPLKDVRGERRSRISRRRDRGDEGEGADAVGASVSPGQNYVRRW